MRGADWPVLVSIPHAGRHCPPWIADAARVSPRDLARLGDAWCDLIAAPLLARGATVVKANVLRGVADCNRHEGDMDPVDVHPALRSRFGPPGRKARAGLGVVPARLPGLGPLWSRPLTETGFEDRLNLVHRPFHDRLAQESARLLLRHGGLLIVDLHSMPALPTSRTDPAPAKIIVGDRFARSSAPAVTRCFAAAAVPDDVRVAANIPYAGGHIVETHGNPNRNVHAVQIEFDRSLYLVCDGTPDPDCALVWGRWLVDCAEKALSELVYSIPLAAE